MRPQSAKSKGRRLQQQVAEDIKTTFTQLSGNDVRSVSMGVNGEDIIMSPLAEELFPYSIECKNCERLSIWSVIDQARRNTNKGKDELVVIKKNHSQPYAVIPWKVFMALHSQAGDANESLKHDYEGKFDDNKLDHVDLTEDQCEPNVLKRTKREDTPSSYNINQPSQQYNGNNDYESTAITSVLQNRECSCADVDQVRDLLYKAIRVCNSLQKS